MPNQQRSFNQRITSVPDLRNRSQFLELGSEDGLNFVGPVVLLGARPTAQDTVTSTTVTTATTEP